MGGNNRIPSFSLSQTFLYLGLSLGLFVIGYLILHMAFLWSILFSILPVAFLLLLLLLKNPNHALVLLFIVNYLIMGIPRYVPEIKGGIVMDGLIALTFAGLLITWFFSHDFPWSNLKNGLMFAVSIWFIFCLLNIFNPIAPMGAWIIGIRRTAGYFILIPVLTFLLFHRSKDMKMIIIIWSVLILLAVLKAIIQKYYGFDYAEKYWLYVDGKAKTHILYSGIRYFSFFTDAANFGCSMAFSMVFFSISAFFVKQKFLKYYYFLISLAAAYGMLISGTRAAIAVPFAGYTLFCLLSGNKKVIATFIILLIGAFVFFYFTSIGQGNGYIRRVRTAFHPEHDASFMLRMVNQQKMRTYMASRPFGVGIGTAKAEQFSSEISDIPTDSWLVMIWVETGVVGLILYLCTIIFIIVKGSYIIKFKIRDKKLQGIEAAFLSGIAGMMVASYANEVVAQFPNGPIIYMTMAFVFLSEKYDQEIEESKQQNVIENERNA